MRRIGRLGGIAGLALLAAGTLATTGCSAVTSVAGPVFNEVRGAHGSVIALREPARDVFGRIASLKFTPATCSLGPRIGTPELLRAYDIAASEFAARFAGVRLANAVPLVCDTDVLYFQKKGLVSGGLLLARVRLRADNTDGGEVLLKAESQAFRAGDEAALSTAAVDALGRFLRREARGEE